MRREKSVHDNSRSAPQEFNRREEAGGRTINIILSDSDSVAGWGRAMAIIKHEPNNQQPTTDPHQL
jgi:hypothetical protein